MTWIRPNLRFWEKLAKLRLDRSAAIEIANLIDGGAPGKPGDCPEEIERVVLRAVERYRPDLAGGVVLGLQFRLECACYEAVYSHPSFPRIPAGVLMDTIDLGPSEESQSVEVSRGAV